MKEKFKTALFVGIGAAVLSKRKLKNTIDELAKVGEASGILQKKEEEFRKAFRDMAEKWGWSSKAEN